METIPITPDRKPQLEAYAQRHGQDTAAALDSVREDYLAWEAEDHEEMLASLREGLEEAFEELRVKYGFPRYSKRKGQPGAGSDTYWHGSGRNRQGNRV